MPETTTPITTPWRQIDRIADNGGIVITDAIGEIIICRVPQLQGAVADQTEESQRRDEELCRRHARLIAVAPLLLEACKAVLPRMEKALAIRDRIIGPIDGGISWTVRALREAISLVGEF